MFGRNGGSFHVCWGTPMFVGSARAKPLAPMRAGGKGDAERWQTSGAHDGRKMLRPPHPGAKIRGVQLIQKVAVYCRVSTGRRKGQGAHLRPQDRRAPKSRPPYPQGSPTAGGRSFLPLHRPRTGPQSYHRYGNRPPEQGRDLIPGVTFVGVTPSRKLPTALAVGNRRPSF